MSLKSLFSLNISSSEDSSKKVRLSKYIKNNMSEFEALDILLGKLSEYNDYQSDNYRGIKDLFIELISFPYSLKIEEQFQFTISSYAKERVEKAVLSKVREMIIDLENSDSNWRDATNLSSIISSLADYVKEKYEDHSLEKNFH